jgi:hypothetical protein
VPSPPSVTPANSSSRIWKPEQVADLLRQRQEDAAERGQRRADDPDRR